MGVRFRPTNKINKNYFVADLYGRLSDEDRNKSTKLMESVSIINQRDYLHYAVEQINKTEGTIPIKVHREYYDDDYTGITFDRPAFQEMMKDVREGIVDCIIVKDFSRFGRDNDRIKKYLEDDFEKKGQEIRFIAYSDHYDSLTDKPDIGVRILLFLNEEYSRSQSHKVTTGMESMMRAGKFIGAFAPYGYKKDPKDKHHLIIDVEVYHNVEEIFWMNLYEGLGAVEIAKRLNAKKIESPTVYKESKGLNYKCGNRIPTTNYWTADTINRILLDEKYTGTMVQHKMRTKDFKKKKMETVAKEEWIKVSNTHEGIISREEFEAVQLLHKNVPKNKNQNKDRSIFAGILKCGDCRHAFIKHRETYKSTVYYSYQCRVHKKDSSQCYTNCIYHNTISNILLSDLNKVIRSIENLEKVVAKCKLLDKNNTKKKGIKSKIIKKVSEQKALQAIRNGIVEKWLLGKLSDEAYEELKFKYQQEINNMEQNILTLQKELEEKKDILSNQWIKSLVKLGYVDKLSREIIVEIVDSIYIYHDNRIEINYKFSKDVEMLLVEENILTPKRYQDILAP